MKNKYRSHEQRAIVTELVAKLLEYGQAKGFLLSIETLRHVVNAYSSITEVPETPTYDVDAQYDE